MLKVDDTAKKNLNEGRRGKKSPSAVPFFLTIYISAMLLGKANKAKYVVAVK